MDRILAAQRLSLVDLLDAELHRAAQRSMERQLDVPVVSHLAAMHEPVIRPQAVRYSLQLPAELLPGEVSRAGHPRRNWDRFVAVRIAAAESAPMEPLVFPEAIVVLDRHYISLAAYRRGRANVYGVRDPARMKLRHVEYQLQRLVLRPHNSAFPAELLDAEQETWMGDVLAGRVVLIFNAV